MSKGYLGMVIDRIKDCDVGDRRETAQPLTIMVFGKPGPADVKQLPEQSVIDVTPVLPST